MKSEMLSLLPDCERNFASLNFNYLHVCSNILNLPTGIAKEELKIKNLLFNCLIVDSRGFILITALKMNNKVGLL